MKKIALTSLLVAGIACMTMADEAFTPIHSFHVGAGYFEPLKDYLGWDGAGVELSYKGYYTEWLSASLNIRGGYAEDDLKGETTYSYSYEPQWKNSYQKPVARAVGTIPQNGYQSYEYSATRHDSKVEYTELQIEALLHISPLRTDTVNFYLTGGGFYSNSSYDVEFDDDTYAWGDDAEGFGWVAGAGLELKAGILGIRLEGNALGELSYDDATKIPDEEIQAQLKADLFFSVSDRFTIDLSGRYYTKWKDLFVMAGVGFKL